MAMKNTSSFLINPYPYYASGIQEDTIYPPVGLLYLAAVLERNGFSARVLDANVLKLSNHEVLKRIKKVKPEIVGISANVVLARAAKELAVMVKKKFPEIFIVMGGPIVSALPEDFLAVCDTVVLHEGEETFLELVERYHCQKKRSIFSLFGSIPGIAFKSKGKIFFTKPRNFINNLDDIPFPAYHLLEPDLGFYSSKSRARKIPVAPILTSRGCPFNCIYCNKSIFGHIFRARTPESVFGEIEYLVTKYGIRQIDILDDNFTLNQARAEKILDLIIKTKFDLALNCQNGIRADKLTSKLIKKMKQAGIFKVGIGIESGDPRILKIIKKDLNLKDVRKAIKDFRKIGIIVHGYFMLGLPGDTEHSMQKTIDFAKNVNPQVANFAIAIPFPGAELYSLIEKKGKFLVDIRRGISSGFFGSQVFYEIDEAKKETVCLFYRKAIREFYFRPQKILDIAMSIHSFPEFAWSFRSGLSLILSILKRPKYAFP